MRLTTRHRIPLLVLITLISVGCGKYWTREQATLSAFAKDHKECLTATGVPVVNDPSRVVPNEQEYRRCLIARGWTRRDANLLDVPAGYYRGYEEREEFKPVKVDELPEQPASSKAQPAQTVEEKARLDQCRQQYAGRGAGQCQ